MDTWKKMLIAATTVTTLLIAGTFIYFRYFARRTLIVSTTTSLYDTGLLNEIGKTFEAQYPDVDVNFIPVGTGVAIQNAENGDADLVLVHSPKLEKTFLTEGYGVDRKIIAYNFFVIIGPETDPAGVNGLNATDALKKIATYSENQTGKVWVSRGDNSGTHQKEQSLWASAGYNYTEISTETWYASAGAGMGVTLQMAYEYSAYALSDIGTYLKYSKDGRINLTALVGERKELLNVYSAIAVNNTRHPSVNLDDAIAFIKFLISDEGQQLIENYGKSDYGQSLFNGAVQPLKQDSLQPTVDWIKEYAFFSGSECPPEYRDAHTELYS